MTQLRLPGSKHLLYQVSNITLGVLVGICLATLKRNVVATRRTWTTLASFLLLLLLLEIGDTVLPTPLKVFL